MQKSVVIVENSLIKNFKYCYFIMDWFYQKCPFCWESISEWAVKCRYCWEFIENKLKGKLQNNKKYENIRLKRASPSKWDKIWQPSSLMLFIIIWISIFLFSIFYIINNEDDTINTDCVSLYNNDFSHRFWAEITHHEVKYSENLRNCVAYIELKQYTSFLNSYLLEYEVYSYRNGEMRRLFWKYIDVPNLNSSIDERNSLIKEAHDYYDNLY